MEKPLRCLVASALFAALHACAQDPQLSQFYAAPLYLNPALTGNTLQDRLGVNYRLQWPGTGPGFRTYALSYDHREESLRSGFGAMVMQDRAGTTNLNFTQAAVSYSYEARLNRRQAIRAGLRGAYTRRSYDPGEMLFADQVIRDHAPVSVEATGLPDRSYWDFSGGLLYFTESYWGGVSFNHLNRPEQGFRQETGTRLPVRASVHGGYRFPLDNRSLRHSETIMTLSAHYKAQDQWDQLDIGGYVEHSPVTFGLWYRGLPGLKAYKPGYSNDDAVVAMLGVRTKSQLRLVYSYDVTVSMLTPKSGGAHEVSLIYEWPKHSKNRRYRAVPCPKF
jgi:type IX secretion system PorP/SprF family membrane protein